MINNHQPIAILGGMGPDASCRLYQLMIELSRSEFGVSENHEYPEIIIDSVPVPEFFSNTQKAEEATFMLKDRVKKLNYLQPDCFGLACNTAHTILADLEQEAGAPFISIASETAKEAKKRQYRRVGLLASPTTIESKIFDKAMSKEGVKVEVLDQAENYKIGEAIKMIIGGRKVQARKMVIGAADQLRQKRVDGLILGCTELPLVFPKKYSLPVLNTLEILGRSLLNRYYRKAEI